MAYYGGQGPGKGYQPAPHGYATNAHGYPSQGGFQSQGYARGYGQPPPPAYGQPPPPAYGRGRGQPPPSAYGQRQGAFGQNLPGSYGQGAPAAGYGGYGIGGHQVPQSHSTFGAPMGTHMQPQGIEPQAKRQRTEGAGQASGPPLGKGKGKGKGGPPQVDDQSRRSLEDFVENFAKDPNTDIHKFDTSLNSTERRIIHQASLKWKLFSKSSGTGDNRTITISKKEIIQEEVSHDNAFDATKEYINKPIKEWLANKDQEFAVLPKLETMELRYVYQLATTFAFHPTVQEDGTVQCTRLAAGDKAKQFSFKTLYTKEMTDVTKLSSVLDEAERPTAAECQFNVASHVLLPIQNVLKNPAVAALAGKAEKLLEGVEYKVPEANKKIPPTDAVYQVNAEAKAKMDEFRSQLPVGKMKDSIVKAFHSHSMMVLSGQTGSGKTTQIPQFILDEGDLPADNPCIICTQPRRIAAMSVAERVAKERGQALGQEVGYQVRFDSQAGENTKLLFVTPGILFHRMQTDPTLKGVGAIIIDEVHERDVYTDFALLVVKKMILAGNCHFKVILMSATLQAEGFVQYFQSAFPEEKGTIPYIDVEGRQFPVKDYYLENALEWTAFELNQIQDAVKIKDKAALDCHSVLAADLTEMQDATNKSASEALDSVLPRLQKALKKPYRVEKILEIAPMPVTKGEKYAMSVRFSLADDSSDWKELALEVYKTEQGQANLTKVKTLASPTIEAKPTTVPASEAPTAAQDQAPKASADAPSTPTSENKVAKMVVPKVHANLIAALVMFFHAGKMDGGILVFLPGMQDIKDVDWALRKFDKVRELWVLKLHSGLPPQDQKKVFEKPPVEGLRKVVLSTNMAESSVTVDDIVFVIDSGLMKERHYNPTSNVASLDCQFVSQVNVVQRRGRAGRVRAGVGVHLFPKDYYTTLNEYPVPELCRTPLEEVCLMVKSIGIGNIQDFIKDAMDPPLATSITNALDLLQTIQALAPSEDNAITSLGRQLSTMPIGTQLGKLLIMAGLLGVLKPVATIAAALSQRNPFNVPFDDASRKKLKEAKEALTHPEIPSDHFLLLNAVQQWEVAPNKIHYCETNNMSNAALHAIKSTREQLVPLVCRNVGASRDFVDRNARHDSLVAAVMAMGLYPNVAWKATESFTHEHEEKSKRALITPDGHRTSCGRDSVNFSRIPDEKDFYSYYERVSYRGTLIIQDCSVTGPIPFLLAARKLDVEAKAQGMASIKADDILRVQCPIPLAHAINGLHKVFCGILHEVSSTRSHHQVPPAILQCMVAILTTPYTPSQQAVPALAPMPTHPGGAYGVRVQGGGAYGQQARGAYGQPPRGAYGYMQPNGQF